MASYVKNPDDGVVHIISGDGCGEFTFCGHDYGEPDDIGEAFVGEYVSGPYTCEKCKEAVDAIRDSLKGARYRANKGPKGKDNG